MKGNLADYARELTLSTYIPHIALDGLVRGVDNVRHDVFLSPKFTEVARLQKEVERPYRFDNLIGRAPQMQEVFTLIRRLASSAVN